MLNKVFLLAVMLFVLCGLCIGENSSMLTKEEMEDNLRLREALLKLKEAKELREKFQREYAMNLEFYESGIVTLKDLNESEEKLENAKLQYEKAIIQLEKTRLGFLSDATRIEILSAKKYLTEDGDRRVSISLKNASNKQKAMASDPSLKEEEVVSLLKIKQLMVSLESGAIISDPYEKIVDELKLGGEVTVDFNLLKDVENLVINLQYGSTVERKNVFLRKESLREIPTIEAVQGSQEGELGTVLKYEIELERLAEEEKRFNLIVLGLPSHFNANFKHNKAIVSNIKFNDKISMVNVTLEVVVPEKLKKELVGETVFFFVAVTKPSQTKAVNSLKTGFLEKSKKISSEDLDKLKCNYVRLDMIPTGKGELEIEVQNRFKEVKLGKKASFRIDVYNSGTLEVKNIDVKITPPFEWKVTADPDSIDSIAPGDKIPVIINAEHNDNAVIGEYDIRIKAEGEAGPESVESDEKNFTVKLAPRAKIVQNSILIGVLVIVVIAISIVSVMVSRR